MPLEARKAIGPKLLWRGYYALWSGIRKTIDDN